MPRRCFWVPADDVLYTAYHDGEWGRPVADDTRLFEKLCLEGFQAGLSWRTILAKRENFRAAFRGFDPRVVARFDEPDVARLLQDAGIVRHRGKIEAAINNANRALEIIEEWDSLAAYVWGFEPDPATRPDRLDEATVRAMATSAESKALSKDLKRRGWKFVGPTTVYAFMQAMGLVNDHEESCSVRAAAEQDRRAFQPPSSSRPSST